MYNVKRLAHLARIGLTDLWPALRLAFNRDPTDDRLNQVYGPWPRAAVVVLALVAVAVGMMVVWWLPSFPYSHHINWPAVVVGAAFAALLRRYLFATHNARDTDFPWLAASVAPAFALVVVFSPLLSHITSASESTGDDNSILGAALVLVTDALGVAAAMTIAVATLCYRRDWIQALFDLAIRLLVFKIMVWVTALILLEVEITGRIVGAVVAAITGWHLPEWLKQLVDQLSYAGLLSIVYLAVIGATWTVCRKSFAELIKTGHIDILEQVVAMAGDKDKSKQEKPHKRHSKP